LPAPAGRGRLQDPPPDPDAALTLLITSLLVLVSLLALGMLGLHLRARRRELLLLRLLDRTDALEALLHATRARMSAMKSVVERVPADIGAVAQASLDADAPVQQGLRNVLEHRLWIAKNAATASSQELSRAVAALERSHQQIESRLQQLEHAGAELAEATRPVVEQQQREPPSLRRSESSGPTDG
jgi:predicted  nucleic acid-binding Zn-ribbon protein